MATRRDQLQSYQFMTQRVISALVMRETDPAQSPLRRGIGAVFGGLMIAVLVAAGFGVYGILTKVGSGKWKVSGSVVIEKETGASFVYLDGVLYPTLNYASAMLAAGRPNPTVSRVAGNSLREVPRGTMIGIAGAPDSLPTAKQRVGLPWTVCATPGADSAGRGVSTVSLVVSRTPTGARQLGDSGLLVADATGGMTYLVWQGRRHLVQESRTAVPALFGAVNPTPVGTAWLNALPAGIDIEAVRVPDRGDRSPAVKPHRIGDVLLASTASGPQHYLVLDDGLAPITPVQLAILRAGFPAEPVPITVAEATDAPRSTRLRQPTGDTQPPATPPALVTPGTGDPLCAVTRDARTPPTIQVGGTVAGLDTAAPTIATTADGAPLADRVLVPTGRVSVVRVLAGPDAQAGSYHLVTDLGIRYPVPSPAVLPLLGYPVEGAVDVPAALLSRIPTGPTLDPRLAALPAAR